MIRTNQCRRAPHSSECDRGKARGVVAGLSEGVFHEKSLHCTLAAVCSAWSRPRTRTVTRLQIRRRAHLPGLAGHLCSWRSSAAIDSDVGIALTFGYRVSERLVVNFGIDGNNVDYQGDPRRGYLPRISMSVSMVNWKLSHP